MNPRGTEPGALLTPDATQAAQRVMDLRERGNIAAALAHLDKTITAHPDVEALRALRADICLQVGRYRQAFDDCVAVLEHQPGNVAALQGLSLCVAHRPHLALQLTSAAPVLAALECQAVDPDLVAQGGWVLVRQSGVDTDDPLLLALLRSALVTDLDVEQQLVVARRRLCLDPPTQPPALARAFVIQGELNEYVWAVSDAEHARLDEAPDWVRQMYGVEHPYAEFAAAANGLPSGGDITAASSKAVQEMYEGNPYPRWQRFNHPVPVPLGDYLQRLTDGTFEPPPTLNSPRMLVAGCGTGREMLSAAMAWQPATVTGFDLSRTSLAYAHVKAEELGFDIELFQADLTSLSDWDEQFDIVVCTGVLHHLEDPVAGWRTLRRLLRPGGVMLIGLYSEVARERISAAQREVANFAPTIEGIRQAREHLVSLPADHPARGAMVLRDFYYASGCRDMLFHVQEHHFTIPRIAAALDELGLEFLAFDTDGATREVHRTLFGSTTNPAYWDTFERLYPDTFLGMYQFWCQRPVA